jgi:hypothetical protein
MPVRENIAARLMLKVLTNAMGELNWCQLAATGAKDESTEH